MFVSRRVIAGRKKPLAPLGPWALDSGGFSEVSMYGEWRTGAAEYVDDVERFATWGQMEWAAPRDWMCEPWIVAKTGLSVREHQERTTADIIDLRQRAPHLPFIPVLQGYTEAEYMDHLALYQREGFDLTTEPLVGIGSVCRRQHLNGGREVIETLYRMGIKLHAFGMKIDGLGQIGYALTSSDSMAWSYGGRKKPSPNCTHKSCANCQNYALEWRGRVLKVLTRQQPSLWSFQP